MEKQEIITSIKEFKQYLKSQKVNENLDTEKDLYWEENHNRLIELTQQIDEEDWDLYEPDPEMADALRDESAKDQALHLLYSNTIEELEDILHTYDL